MELDNSKPIVIYESMKKFINKLTEYRYNHFCKNIIREKTGRIRCNLNSKFVFAKTGKLILNNELHIGYNAIIDNARSSILRIDEGAEVVVNNKFYAYYGADIICFKNAKLVLNGGFINSDVKIRCASSITIGEGACISHDVTILDNDGHFISVTNPKVK